MSWIPFVSRGRYEDMAQRVRALETERTELIDRLLAAYGAKTSRSDDRTPAVTTDVESAAPVKNRLTASDIAARCTAAKAREAQALQVAKKGVPPPPPTERES